MAYIVAGISLQKSALTAESRIDASTGSREQVVGRRCRNGGQGPKINKNIMTEDVSGEVSTGIIGRFK